jgi:transcription-repair coupling factor (superfamily II helicase)
VDIPNANTLIIEDSDRMGLAQLHQIRGRVGRGGRQAYAYFTYRQGKALSDISRKRLEAIREYAEFGAGFRIALRDMEIRGAGNILGAEQHGHLEAIGYDLYIKLLNDAVLEEKGETPREKGECVVSLNHDAHIPEKYVKYAGQRMALYKRIALIRNQYDVDDIADELLDRFGDMPDAVDNLLRIALIRARAIELGIKQITETAGEIRMYQDTLNMPMWSEMSFAVGGRLRVIKGSVGDSFVAVKLKGGESSLIIVNKMFENYLETIQTNELKSDEE